MARLVLTLVVLIIAPASAKVDANSFGDAVVKFYGDKTIVVSPTSLNVVLHIAKDASRGITRRQIEALLFDDNAKDTSSDSSVKISSDSKAWIETGYHSAPGFQQLLQDRFGASISDTRFETGEGERAVNAWIAQVSGGDVHGTHLSNLTRAAIVNVSAFYGPWEKKFDPKDTSLAPFNGRNSPQIVPMMQLTASLPYYEDARGQTVGLDYAGNYRMLLFLPKDQKAHPLQEFIRQGIVQPNGIAGIKLFLPRFHLNTEVNLIPVVRSMGVTAAFTSLADFSRLLGVRGTPVGVLFQNNDVKVDELGTTAKSATELSIKLKILVPRSRPKLIEIHFDRPFAFAIVRIANNPITMFEGQLLDVGR